MLKISNGGLCLTLNGTDISLTPRLREHCRRGERMRELNNGEIYSKRVSAGHEMTRPQTHRNLNFLNPTFSRSSHTLTQI